MKKLTRKQMAWRAAQDLADGSVVNLGIGIPVLAADYVPAGRDLVFMSENGVIGVGPEAAPAEADPDLVDAGSRRVTLRAGATIIDSAASFAMIRGGHIDVTLLGAFEVSSSGDLANWDARVPDRGALVGGAMDLATCAGTVRALMEHITRDGRPRLLAACALPLTAARCVSRIYTDLAVIDVVADGFYAREIVAGLSIETLRALTGASVGVSAETAELRVPDL